MSKFIYPLLGIILFGCQNKKNDSCIALNVMSYNVRYDNPDDSLNNWKYRRDNAAKAILFYDADIVGTQEVLNNQLNDFKERLPLYEAIGVGRDDGATKGEYSAIFYKKNRFEVLFSGYFWLSATPDSVGSFGWDAACVRIATWAILKDKTTGKQFFAMDTHLDHKGSIARANSVKLLLEKATVLSKGLPIVLTGDFNADPQSTVIQAMVDTSNPQHLISARDVAPVVYGPAWTFHAFGQLPLDQRAIIDYIFVNQLIEVKSFGVLAETNNTTYLSDHAPILARIVIK